MTNNTNNATAEQGSIASRIIQGDCLLRPSGCCKMALVPQRDPRPLRVEFRSRVTKRAGEQEQPSRDAPGQLTE